MIVRKPNTLGIVSEDRHLFLFRPSQAQGNYSAWGFHLRLRRHGIWRHFLVKLHAKSKTWLPGTRRPRIYEVAVWRSRNATNNGTSSPKRDDNRIGFKRYVRVKICPGGIRPEERV